MAENEIERYSDRGYSGYRLQLFWILFLSFFLNWGVIDKCSSLITFEWAC